MENRFTVLKGSANSLLNNMFHNYFQKIRTYVLIDFAFVDWNFNFTNIENFDLMISRFSEMFQPLFLASITLLFVETPPTHNNPSILFFDIEDPLGPARGV